MFALSGMRTNDAMAQSGVPCCNFFTVMGMLKKLICCFKTQELRYLFVCVSRQYDMALIQTPDIV